MSDITATTGDLAAAPVRSGGFCSAAVLQDLWPRVAGAQLAAHTQPGDFAAGQLTIFADSAAWATHARLMSAALRIGLNAALGSGLVETIKVRRGVGHE